MGSDDFLVDRRPGFIRVVERDTGYVAAWFTGDREHIVIAGEEGIIDALERGEG